MRLRRSVPVIVVVGLLTVVPGLAPAAHAVTGEEGLDVAVDRIDGTHLVGTVTCAPGPRAVLSGGVVQSGGELPVTGRIGTSYLDCAGQPVPFRLPISGDGVLVPGVVQYELSAFTDGPWTFVDVAGEVTQTRRADLGTEPVTFGPLPITIDERASRASTGPVITGTVTCAEPQVVELRLGGWQVADRYHLPIELVGGEPQVTCDGVMPFSLPIQSRRGELRAHPATVWVGVQPMLPPGSGRDDPMPESSGTGRRVTLRTSTPEPDFVPVPDASAPVAVVAVWRVGDDHRVGLTSVCPAGATVELRVEVRPVSARVAGRWWNPSELGRQTDRLGVTCDGVERTQVVTLPASFDADEVAVVVDGWTRDPATGNHTFSTGAVVPVSTK